MNLTEKNEKEVKKITMNQFKDMNNNQIKEEVRNYNLFIIMGDLTLLKVEEFKLQ